jgi:putative transcriptional regulator
MIKYKLKVELAKNEMTQLELHNLTGIRTETISNIATGKIKRIPVEVLEKLCKTLNCGINDLIEYTTED